MTSYVNTSGEIQQIQEVLAFLCIKTNLVTKEKEGKGNL